MDSEKEFKDILSDKLGSKEFNFDADSWEQARAMVDASREEKKKRPVAWIFLSAAMLIVGGFALYLFNSSEPSEHTSVASTPENKQTETPVENKSSETKENQNTTPEKPIITSENKTKEDHIVPVTENNSAKKEITSVNKKKTDDAVNTERKNTRKYAAIKNESEGKEIVTNVKTTETKSENTVTVSETKTASENSSVPAVTKKPKKKSKKDQSENVIPSLAVNVKNTENKKPVKTSFEKGNAETVDKTTAKDPVVKQSNPAETKSEVKSETKTPESVNEGSDVPASSTTIAAASSTVEEIKSNTATNPVTETTVSVSENVTKVDSATAITQTPARPPKVYNGTVSLEGGINYFLGYKNPGKRDGRGYNPIAGINYSTRIYKRIGITLGAQYYSVGQLSFSNHTSKITRYRLGEESDVTVITPTTLHYIGFPVLFGFNLNDKHSFGVGCNVGYLMNVTGKVETYNENFKGISNLESSKTMGYTEGFRPFDTQLLLMYKRKIINDLYVNTGFVIGLSDIKDNAFFNSNVYERNLGVKFTLSYNLIKK
jgi:hypothetical protein